MTSDCCKSGFKWHATPTGTESSFAGTKTYVTGTSKSIAILYVHDIFGWTFPNARLLADYYAENANATVYVPDLYPTILNFATALRSQYPKVAAIGFCYGGWAVFRLGANGLGLVDCIATAHPSLLEDREIEALGVPTQILAPERDFAFTEELKGVCNRVIPANGVPYEYVYFPGLEHGFATRGDREDEVQRRGLERAARAAVGWFNEWLS
ncbi:endo-1,3-1,4-beta-D-glucanase [Aspergillus steynii IBT 23096]|uniref:Endo-1,3-1,4-beta-D-glucanase n=1 Tax=Aspergillus steynii IBT 23096 TaxID=1392250 RepID=A0A2I2G126_9EURO|nr:endo-1,3-1,4-beta-D-glucanase [Aspergillus steynii IBT 23096]PLB46546.1 endo-1,3-1,4-beta-D-glucanase [Aspergillus steynii IBT 23096]